MTFFDNCHKRGTDKWKYAGAYEEIFAGEKPMNLLEFGVQGGSSLWLWSDVFPGVQITGVDLNLSSGLRVPTGTKLMGGGQEDAGVLSELKAAGPWDIVIDDAGHQTKAQRVSWDALHSLTRKYVIEDLTEQDAAYWRGVKEPTKEYKSTATPEWLFLYENRGN